jgi:hypothetical protein
MWDMWWVNMISLQREMLKSETLEERTSVLRIAECVVASALSRQRGGLGSSNRLQSPLFGFSSPKVERVKRRFAGTPRKSYSLCGSLPLSPRGMGKEYFYERGSFNGRAKRAKVGATVEIRRRRDWARGITKGRVGFVWWVKREMQAEYLVLQQISDHFLLELPPEMYLL